MFSIYGEFSGYLIFLFLETADFSIKAWQVNEIVKLGLVENIITQLKS